MALGTSGRDRDTCTGKYAKWLEAEPPSLKCVCGRGRGRGGAPCLSPSSVGDHNRPSLSALPIHSLARGKGTGCQAEKREPDARQRNRMPAGFFKKLNEKEKA